MLAQPAGPKLLRMPSLAPLVAAVFHLDGRPRYVHSGWFLISVPNLIVILLMIVVFVLAIVIPFPHSRKKQ
jgi:hypothetical protein